MTDQQVSQALDLYEQMLKARGAEPIEVPHSRCPASPEEALNHALSMIAPMRQFLVDGKREKLMRWLGFLQAILWCTQIFPLDSLKDHAFSHLFSNFNVFGCVI